MMSMLSMLSMMKFRDSKAMIYDKVSTSAIEHRLNTIFLNIPPKYSDLD